MMTFKDVYFVASRTAAISAAHLVVSSALQPSHIHDHVHLLGTEAGKVARLLHLGFGGFLSGWEGKGGTKFGTVPFRASHISA